MSTLTLVLDDGATAMWAIWAVPLIAAAAGALLRRRERPSDNRASRVLLAASVCLLTVLLTAALVAPARASAEMERLRTRTGAAASEVTAARLPFALVSMLVPWQRRSALAELAGALASRRDPDPPILTLREEVLVALADREGQASLWIDHGEPERGAAVAEAIGSPWLAALGDYRAGDFEKAAMALRDREAVEIEDLRFRLGMLLLAGRLGDEASRAAEVLAAALARTGAGPDATTAECLRGALAHQLTAEDATPKLPGCLALQADLRSGESHIAWIRAAGGGAADRAAAWLSVLATEVDPHALPGVPAPPVEPTAALILPDGVPGGLFAVERRIADALATDEATSDAVVASRVHTLERAALFALRAGDREAAGRYASAIGRDRDHRRTALVDTLRIDEMEALAAFLLPGWGTTVASEYVYFGGGSRVYGLMDLSNIGGPQVLLQKLAALGAAERPEFQSWKLTGGGDGAALAEWLRTSSSPPGSFLRFTRRHYYRDAPNHEAGITRGEPALCLWVHHGFHPPRPFDPAREMTELADRAEAAASLGDDPLAMRLHDAAMKFERALLRRDTAVPLAVLSTLWGR